VERALRKDVDAAVDASLGLAFSANGVGNLTVVREIDDEHFSVVATIPTQPRARTVALDPLTHRLYLVTAVFGPTPLQTASAPHPRPAMLEDTFTLLVVQPS